MIAEKLLEENIIACANVFPPHKAVYRWEDKVESEEETAMILKTRSEHFERIQDTVKALHSYDTPAIISIPIQNALPDFLSFIDEETTKVL